DRRRDEEATGCVAALGERAPFDIGIARPLAGDESLDRGAEAERTDLVGAEARAALLAEAARDALLPVEEDGGTLVVPRRAAIDLRSRPAARFDLRCQQLLTKLLRRPQQLAVARLLSPRQV